MVRNMHNSEPYTKPSSRLCDLIIFTFYHRLFYILELSAAPYSDNAHNRRKYGDKMLKKGEQVLTTQRQYESEAKAKIDAARQKRQEERDRLEALEVIFLILFSRNYICNSIHSTSGWKSFINKPRYLLKSGGWQGCTP